MAVFSPTIWLMMNSHKARENNNSQKIIKDLLCQEFPDKPFSCSLSFGCFSVCAVDDCADYRGGKIQLKRRKWNHDSAVWGQRPWLVRSFVLLLSVMPLSLLGCSSGGRSTPTMFSLSLGCFNFPCYPSFLTGFRIWWSRGGAVAAAIVWGDRLLFLILTIIFITVEPCVVEEIFAMLRTTMTTKQNIKWPNTIQSSSIEVCYSFNVASYTWRTLTCIAYRQAIPRGHAHAYHNNANYKILIHK